MPAVTEHAEGLPAAAEIYRSTVCITPPILALNITGSRDAASSLGVTEKHEILKSVSVEVGSWNFISQGFRSHSFSLFY